MTNLDSFTLALRRASEAHPELRLGGLILKAVDEIGVTAEQFMCGIGLDDILEKTTDADLTEALNRFAEKG